jgi:hypothetical protein
VLIRNGNTMTSADLRIPDNTCAYEKYDPANLTPLNQSTCTRLTELNWSTEQFQNKTVLEIGCNSGILSLYANKLGAKLVTAIDVQKPSTGFFSSVVSMHNLSIRVEKNGFSELSPASHAADVVLYMDVLPSLADPHRNIADTIYKLATLTNETLYLETPWEANDSSFTEGGALKSEQYNIELVIKELQKYFEIVQVVRSMSHFDEMETSKSLLIKASAKRDIFESMRYLTGVNPLNISLKRGTNPIQLMTSASGPVILKTLPHESMLPLLDADSANQFFNTLRTTNGHLLPALEYGGKYIFKNSNNEHLMVFPFVGNLGDYFQNHSNHAPVSNPLRLAVECRRTLRHIPTKVIQAIKDKSAPITLKPRNELGIYFNHLIDTQGLTGFIDDVFKANEIADRSVENCVVHNDLQLGNMITDNNGKDWILDLDILRSGTAYSDFICCAIFNNSPREAVIALYKEMVEINGRHLQLTDMYFAMNILLRWIYTLNRYHKPSLDTMGETTVSGIKTLHSIMMVEQPEQQIAC